MAGDSRRVAVAVTCRHVRSNAGQSSATQPWPGYQRAGFAGTPPGPTKKSLRYPPRMRSLAPRRLNRRSITDSRACTSTERPSEATSTTLWKPFAEANGGTLNTSTAIRAITDLVVIRAHYGSDRTRGPETRGCRVSRRQVGSSRCTVGLVCAVDDALRRFRCGRSTSQSGRCGRRDSPYARETSKGVAVTSAALVVGMLPAGVRGRLRVRGQD